MISLRKLSIPKKIVAIAMIISAAALLLASAALIGYDYVAARRELRASTTTSARIVADEFGMWVLPANLGLRLSSVRKLDRADSRRRGHQQHLS